MAEACFVCGGLRRPVFRKESHFPGLPELHYERCEACGLVVSRTHLELSPEAWSDLNHRYHEAYQGTGENADDPRWMGRMRLQADCLHELAGLGLIPGARPWLDFGAGDGTLARLLAERGRTLQGFDPYMTAPGYLPESALVPGGFDLVVNTSVFEHVRDRAPLDRMASLVSPDGVFAIHTLVSEEVPTDPDWFYLLPVHCAFFTNRAMERLFREWGFRSSLYHPPARMWFFLRRPLEAYPQASALTGDGRYAGKDAFMDYWK